MIVWQPCLKYFTDLLEGNRSLGSTIVCPFLVLKVTVESPPALAVLSPPTVAVLSPPAVDVLSPPVQLVLSPPEAENPLGGRATL